MWRRLAGHRRAAALASPNPAKCHYSTGAPPPPKPRRFILGIETDQGMYVWGGALLVLGIASIYGTYHRSQRDERKEQRRLERKETRQKIVQTVLDKFGNKTTATAAAAAGGEVKEEDGPVVVVGEHEEALNSVAAENADKKVAGKEWTKKVRDGAQGKLHSILKGKEGGSGLKEG